MNRAETPVDLLRLELMAHIDETCFIGKDLNRRPRYSSQRKGRKLRVGAYAAVFVEIESLQSVSIQWSDVLVGSCSLRLRSWLPSETLRKAVGWVSRWEDFSTVCVVQIPRVLSYLFKNSLCSPRDIQSRLRRAAHRRGRDFIHGFHTRGRTAQMALVGSLCFCTDCGSLLDRPTTLQQRHISCDLCGASNASMDFVRLFNCNCLQLIRQLAGKTDISVSTWGISIRFATKTANEYPGGPPRNGDGNSHPRNLPQLLERGDGFHRATATQRRWRDNHLLSLYEMRLSI